MVGFVSLVIAFVAIIVSVLLLGIAAIKRPKPKEEYSYMALGGHVATILSVATLTLCCGILVYCFMTGDISIQYVVQYRSNADGPMGALYKLSGLWGGRQGSLLFWAWLIAIFNLVVVIRAIRSKARIDNMALAISQLVLVAFVGVLLFSDSNMPFKALEAQYIDEHGHLTGTAALWGMNALLEHWAMAIHPPTLFVGYAGLTIPFAYAIAAIILNDPSKLWVTRSVRFALFSWLFLGIGIGLGSVWAYVVLGWGGYWGWDPVENASLLSWLACVALIHSFTVYRQRGIFKRWAVVSACAAFAFVIVGTFISRSGLVQSVHAFEGDPVSLGLFLGLIIASMAAGIIGVCVRYKSFAPQTESAAESDSFFSKDMMYYFNNFIMLFMAALLMYMTVSSALPTWMPFGGQSLSAVTYNTIARPLGIIYCLIMAVCPLMAWGKTDPKVFFKQARIPAALALVLFIGLLVLFFTTLLPNYNAMVAAGGDAAKGVTDYGPSFYYHGLAILGFLVASLLFFNSLFMIGRQLRAAFKKREDGSGPGSAKKLAGMTSSLGGFLSHFAMAIILIGLIGSSMYVYEKASYLPYTTENAANKEIATQDYVVGDYRLTNTDSRIQESPNGDDVYYTLVFDVYKGDQFVGTVEPTIQLVQTTQQQKLNASVIGFPLEDLFVVYRGVNGQGAFAMDVRVNPLISFVWVGFGLLMVGTAISSFGPRSRKAKKVDAASA
jgi:cytochrome c-type biogenesis protein CcmF